MLPALFLCKDLKCSLNIYCKNESNLKNKLIFLITTLYLM